MDYFDPGKGGKIPAINASVGGGWDDPTGGKAGKIAPITKERDRWALMPEEAVMKIVANLDSNAISADAMKLT